MTEIPKYRKTKASWDKIKCCWCGKTFDPHDGAYDPDYGVSYVETYCNGTLHKCTHCGKNNWLESELVSFPDISERDMKGIPND